MMALSLQEADENKEEFLSRRRRLPFVFSAFAQEVKDWAEHSTFHGIRSVFSSDSNWARKLFWLCVIGGSIYSLQYGYSVQINRYLKYRTIGKETISAGDIMTFPAITICSTCLLRNDTKRNAAELNLLFDMFTGANASTLIDKYDADFLRDFKMSEMYLRYTPSPKEMFYYCGWSRKPFNCSEYVKRQMFTRNSCFTINGDVENAMKSQGSDSESGLYLVLDANQDNHILTEFASTGFKILIHDQSVDPDMTLGTYLSPGYAYYIGISKIEHKLMPAPVKALGDSKCLDIKADTFQNPLKMYDTYSFSACETECMAKYIENSCGCVNPVKPGNFNECPPVTTVSCAFPAYAEYYKNSAAIIDDCGCMIPCEFSQYKMKLSSAYFPNINYIKQNEDIFPGKMQNMSYVRANFLSVTIFFETKIIRKFEQILEFPILDLVASLSGYLGLAIGASVLTFLEFFEIFFIVIGRLFNKH